MARPVSAHAVSMLALAHLRGVGRRRLRRLGERAAGAAIGGADALEAFVASAAGSFGMAAPGAAACLRAWDDGQRVAATCWRHGWHVWAFGGADYPARFRELTDPPALLFVHGAETVPAARCVAIVGTREPTPWGERMADACAREVVSAGGVVVAGLAWGIDTAAHAGAVSMRGPTWAMLPAAIDIIYPESNRRLATEIVDAGGALVSEYLPGTRPQPTFFVQRDRLQAALADVVLVVETGRTGGTHHTIRFARELGRPVWVTLPDDVNDGPPGGAALPEAQLGTWDLWRQGAQRTTPAALREWVAGAATKEAHAQPAARPLRLF